MLHRSRAWLRKISTRAAGMLLIPFLLVICPFAAGQTLSFTVPTDIAPVPNTIAARTAAFVNFSWRTFIALNWPAAVDASGRALPIPDQSRSPAGEGAAYITVWEAWPDVDEVFLPAGEKPAPFGQPHLIPAACATITVSGPAPTMVLRSISKGGAVLSEFVQAFRMGPVIDANGQYVRFGINFNKQMHDYIIDNDLYSAAGQQTFAGTHPDGASFPRGSLANNEVGSIMVKSSWKILGTGDAVNTFHRIPVYVYNPPQPDARESCRLAQVGLVGFHITHRTYTAPQWVWSTFEHASNAPNWAQATGQQLGPSHYSFFDAEKCPVKDNRPSCRYNTLPQRPWDPEITKEPTLIVRTGNVSPEAQRQNAVYRRYLQGIQNTVWGNYFLVDVQWPSKLATAVTVSLSPPATVNPAYPYGEPVPNFLANSTMETYIQGFTAGDVTSNGNLIPPGDTSATHVTMSVHVGSSGGAARNTSSCVNCHGDAAMTTGLPGNFVFSLNRAE